MKKYLHKGYTSKDILPIVFAFLSVLLFVESNAQSVQRVLSANCVKQENDFVYNQGSCSACTFVSWSITGSPVITGSGSSITVKWNNPGTYTVRANYNTPSGTASTSPLTVTISGQSLTITGSTSSCLGVESTYTTQTGMTSYTWSANGGTVTAGQGTRTATIRWNASGTRSVTVVASKDGCTSSISQNVSVTGGIANLSISENPIDRCSTPGLTVVYSTQSGMDGYSWGYSSDAELVGGSVSSNTITLRWPVVSGRFVSVTGYSGGCTSSVTRNVNIPALQVPTFTTGPTDVCVGSTGNIYTTQSPSQNVIFDSYQWQISSGGTFTQSTWDSHTVPVTWHTAGNQWISISYMDAGPRWCMSPPTVRNVTVHPRPVPTFTLGQSRVCPGITSRYETQAGMVNYEWSVPAPGTIVAGGSTSNNWVEVQWQTPGQYQLSVNYTYSVTSCSGTTPAIMNVTVPPGPDAYQVSGGGYYCQPNAPSSVHLSGSQPGINYQLRMNGSNVGSPIIGTGNALVWNNVSGAGIYTVVAKDSECDRLMGGEAVITYMAHDVPVLGPSEIGDTPVTLSINPLPGYSYQWTYEGVDIANATFNTLLAEKPGGYQVILTYGECSSVSQLFYLSRKANRYYNGIISSVRWRTEHVQGTGEGDLEGMYVFDYDKKYQIREAQWAVPDFTLNTFTSGGNNFKVKDISYDPNGNILRLKRYNGTGEMIHDFNYDYEYEESQPKYNNKLKSVSGYVNAYQYNLIGQMIGEDKVDVPAGASSQAGEGKDQYIEYDVTGKVRKVFSDPAKTQESLKVEFLYDDKGFRLAKKNYETNKTTWYIRDASGSVMSIYEENMETNALVQKEIPVYGAGKLGTTYPQEKYSTAYELTDHLGNVRALISERESEFVATMEDSGVPDFSNPRVREIAVFENLFETEKKDARFNHTPGGEYSSYLHWRNGMDDFHKSIGPATAIRVHAGETINLETWARFEKNQYSYLCDISIEVFAQFLGNAFANYGVFEGMSSAQTAERLGTILDVIGHNNGGLEDLRPIAYLNYIMFDEHTNFLDAGWEQIPYDAGFDPGQEALPDMHKRMAIEHIQVPVDGYIYVWLSNEAENSKVWFDDLKITRSGGVSVVQSTDYGPWGDVVREQNYKGSKSLKESLQAGYSFNGNAHDAGLHQMDGIVNGASLTTDKEGNPGAAYSFDGDDYIELPDSKQKLSFIQNTSRFAITMFLKLTNLDSLNYIVGNVETRPQKGFRIVFGQGAGIGPRQIGFIKGLTNGAQSSTYPKSAANCINDTDWHHVAIVGDGRVVTFYIDGVQSGSPTRSTSYSSGDGTFDVVLGGVRNASGDYAHGFQGSIDEFMIFDRALTADEVKALSDNKTVERIDHDDTNSDEKYRWYYQGQYAERDEETGWNHFELRQYDPVIGRWTTRDPFKQYWSPYNGMGNNPVSGVDPDGGFETKFGAWLYRTFNGGGEIYNDGSEWVVGMPHTIEYDQSGSPTYWVNSVSDWGNGNKTFGDHVWNHPLTRFYVPDYVGISFFNVQGVAGLGGSIDFDLIWTLRGDEASWKPLIAVTPSLGAGAEVGFTVGVNAYSYLGNAHDIKRGFLETNSFDKNSPTIGGYGSLSIPVINGGISVTLSPAGKSYLLGRQYNIGVGTGGGSVGVFNTYILHDFYKK